MSKAKTHSKISIVEDFKIPETKNPKQKSKWEFSKVKLFGLFGMPLIFTIILMLDPPAGLSSKGWHVLGVAFLMIGWWITEAVPVPVASLLPIILYPSLGIFDMKTSAAPYASPSVFLYMGGFMLAIAIEKWKLHMRIALGVVKIIGTNANGIIAGVLLATGTLSMWMSNTATVVMILPICFSVINLLMKGHEEEKPENSGYKNFAACMMLATSYGASIGGIATIIGTPTNTIFSNYMNETYGYEVGFGQWMLVGTIFMILMLYVTWLTLIKLFPNNLGNLEKAKSIIDTEFENLGKMSIGEKLVLLIFAITAILWSFKIAINKMIPGLELKDELIALMSGISLFLVPVNLKSGKFLLDWKSAEKLPWGILLLFGGGLSLAQGVENTGLVDVLGGLFKGKLGTLSLIALSCFATVFLTQFMGNMALITIFLPVLTSISIAYEINPLLIMLPATIGASCAFCLPISTPPNAIVLSSGHLKISQMIKAGTVVSIISWALTVALTFYLVPFVFGLDIDIFPDLK